MTAPKGAPNVLLIMTDDTGFGAASTFGGPIPTPNFDRVHQERTELQPVSHHGAVLADAGRAAHRPQPPHLGIGNITEFATGYPGYTRSFPRASAPSATFSSTTATTRRGSASTT